MTDNDPPLQDSEILSALADQQFNRNCECLALVCMLDSLKHAYMALINEYYNEHIVGAQVIAHRQNVMRSIRVVEELLGVRPSDRFDTQEGVPF